MGQATGIEWTDHTFNPWRGCTKVSPGCANCYAETLSHRNPKTLGLWGPTGVRAVASEPYWRQPLRWDQQAKAAGVRRRVFCASLADVFEDWAGPMTAAPHNTNRSPRGCEVAGQSFVTLGKKAAGRLLDGREWSEFPQTRAERGATA